MYKALRGMKVQGADGVVRVVKPGDDIPEAADWKSLKAYIARKWICRDDDKELLGKVFPSKARASVAVSVDPIVRKPQVEVPVKRVAIPDPPKPATFKKHTEKSLSFLSKKELQSIAKSLDIDPQQSKADLVASVLAVQ
jgi:hypothetical protein